MKTTKFLLTALLAIMFAPEVWADDGETFTVQTSEGVTMTFQVVSEALKTCQVGTGSTCCIDKEYTGAVTVPATANGYDVKQIGDFAFGLSKAASITLPNSIVAIGSYAFWMCNNLQTMTIPSGVTYFGADGATFIQCANLQTIIVSEGVTQIPDDFANQCQSLTSVSLPEGVTSIGATAFIDCTALTEIVIPASVTTIGEDAFKLTNHLQRVEVKNPTPVAINTTCFSTYESATLVVPFGSLVDYQGAANWSSFAHIDDHSVFTANVAEGVEVTFRMLSENACQVGDGTNRAINTSYSGAITIPEIVNGLSVISIGDKAFWSCSITELSLPATLTSLGDNSVSSCGSLAKVYAYMTYPPIIDNTTFSLSLQADLYVPYTSMTNYQSDSGWKQFHRILPFSTDPTVIIDVNADGSLYTFYKVISESDKTCQIGLGQEGNTAIPATYAGEFNVPASVNGYTVKKVGAHAFNGCSNITSMILPEGLEEIGDYAFKSTTDMTTVSLPESLEKIGQCAFLESGITAVDLPENTLLLGLNAFYHCAQLASVKLPSQINTLSACLFEGCSSLTSIVIPNSVKTISMYCFAGTALTSILLPESLEKLSTNAFQCNNLTTVVSPLQQPISITENTFSNRANATLYVPAGCKSNYLAAGLYWPQFKEIIDDKMVSMSPENVLIHFRVISEDDKTCEVYRDVNTAAIDGYNQAQQGAATVNVTVPSTVQGYTVTRIGQHAFYHCNQVTGVNLPTTIKEIGSQAFYLAAFGNTPIMLPEGLEHLDDNAFESSNIVNVVIPSTLTSISNYAFKGCALTNLVIPNTVESIGTEAFNHDGMGGKTTAVTVFRTTPLPIDGNCFSLNPNGSILYVPAGSKEAYEKATGWSKFANIVELGVGGTGLKGDVNKDGKVSITDAVEVVNIILNAGATAAPALEPEPIAPVQTSE